MIIEDITKFIKVYNGTSIEPQNLHQLIKLRKKLSSLSYGLAVETAQYKKDYDECYYKRKVEFFKAKNEATGTQSERETSAEIKIQDFRRSEKVSESLFVGNKIILTQINEVLRSINQDIAQLRTEANGEV